MVDQDHPEGLKDCNVERDLLWLDYKRLQAEADAAQARAVAAHGEWVRCYVAGRQEGKWK